MTPESVVAWTGLIIAIFAGIASLRAMVIEVVKAAANPRLAALDALIVELRAQLAAEVLERKASDAAKDATILELNSKLAIETAARRASEEIVAQLRARCDAQDGEIAALKALLAARDTPATAVLGREHGND